MKEIYYFKYSLVNNPCGLDENNDWKDYFEFSYPNANDDVILKLDLYAYMKDGYLYDVITSLPVNPYNFLPENYRNYETDKSWLAFDHFKPVAAEEVEKQTNKINKNETMAYCYSKLIANAYKVPSIKYNMNNQNIRTK